MALPDHVHTSAANIKSLCDYPVFSISENPPNLRKSACQFFPNPEPLIKSLLILSIFLKFISGQGLNRNKSGLVHVPFVFYDRLLNKITSMKHLSKILLLLILLGIALPAPTPAQKKPRKSKTSYGNTYKTKKTKTYKTEYDYGKTYKTTGKTKVKRSKSNRDAFLKQKGYKKVPPGYDVDHIIPLSKGGTDTPDNMQLIPKSTHKEKTKAERKSTSKSSYKKSSTKKSYSYKKSRKR